MAKKLQTLGLTGEFDEKNAFFVTFDRTKCDKQQDTVPLYIAKGLNFILNFYCCRFVALTTVVKGLNFILNFYCCRYGKRHALQVEFEFHIKFLLL